MKGTLYNRFGRGLTALLAAAFAVPAGVVGTVALTPAPAPAQFGISEKQELEAGREAAQQIEQKSRVVRGTREARLVEQIGNRMADVSGRSNIDWQFRVIEDPSINAFAVPGYVYVHTGLLREVRGDEDALAGVIAHEVAHTDAKHSKKQMEKSAVAGLLGALITRGNRNSAGWFNLAGNLVMLNYSRNDEYEADRLAVRYMLRTGYDPNGMIRFFKKLQQKEGRGDKLTTWFRTHPNSGDRITRIQREMREQR